VVGVVKSCLGNPEVAKAMIAGGAGVIADSRLDNLKRLSCLNTSLMMLRQPMSYEIEEAVSIVDYFLVSEITTVEKIAERACGDGKIASLIVMVELGDLREGVIVEELANFIAKIYRMPGIKVHGVGTNVACLQNVPPTPEMLEKLVALAGLLRAEFKMDLPVISGGNSSAWNLLKESNIPKGINQLRFGEGILLGQETIKLESIEGTSQDAFMLYAEVIEIKEKPIFQDGKRKVMKRAILALGLQDICCGKIKPVDKEIEVLRRSSDHLIVDIGKSAISYKTGDRLGFIPSYEAMLGAMTSPFVDKILK
jgi:ornithine racemase